MAVCSMQSRSIVVDCGQWWSMVVVGGRWWSMVVVGGRRGGTCTEAFFRRCLEYPATQPKTLHTTHCTLHTTHYYTQNTQQYTITTTTPQHHNTTTPQHHMLLSCYLVILLSCYVVMLKERDFAPIRLPYVSASLRILAVSSSVCACACVRVCVCVCTYESICKNVTVRVYA